MDVHPRHVPAMQFVESGKNRLYAACVI